MGARKVLVEAKLSWHDDVLAIEHVDPKRVLRVGDLGLPVVPDAELIVSRIEDGRVVLVRPDGDQVPDGCRMTVDLGEASLHLALVAREGESIPRRTPDGRVLGGVLLAAALHGAVIALAFHGRAAGGDEDEAAVATMRGYLAAADERAARDAVNVLPPPPREEPEDGAPAPTATKEEGTAGHPVHTNENARARDSKGVVRHAKESGEEDPSLFGLLSIMSAERVGDRAGSSPWATDLGPAAMGNMFGATIEDAAGSGGLGLSGQGAGGGGKGEGVSLGAMHGMSGTCGDGCTGTGSGHGRARGALVSGEHGPPRWLYLRCEPSEGCTPKVNGRLPPEAVQRVVRDNFGRMRACYEAGLQRDPGLEGRIAVKFVIDREGAVAMASTEERSLPDGAVASCVQRAFHQMTFPRPEGGIVTVVYPIVFSTSP